MNCERWKIMMDHRTDVDGGTTVCEDLLVVRMVFLQPTKPTVMKIVGRNWTEKRIKNVAMYVSNGKDM